MHGPSCHLGDRLSRQYQGCNADSSKEDCCRQGKPYENLAAEQIIPQPAVMLSARTEEMLTCYPAMLLFVSLPVSVLATPFSCPLHKVQGADPRQDGCIHQDAACQALPAAAEKARKELIHRELQDAVLVVEKGGKCQNKSGCWSPVPDLLQDLQGKDRSERLTCRVHCSVSNALQRQVAASPVCAFRQELDEEGRKKQEDIFQKPSSWNLNRISKPIS